MRKRKLYTFVNRSRHLTLTKMIYIKKIFPLIKVEQFYLQYIVID